jgi:hypothetical protein
MQYRQSGKNFYEDNNNKQGINQVLYNFAVWMANSEKFYVCVLSESFQWIPIDIVIVMVHSPYSESNDYLIS